MFELSAKLVKTDHLLNLLNHSLMPRLCWFLSKYVMRLQWVTLTLFQLIRSQRMVTFRFEIYFVYRYILDIFCIPVYTFVFINFYVIIRQRCILCIFTLEEMSVLKLHTLLTFCLLPPTKEELNALPAFVCLSVC